MPMSDPGKNRPGTSKTAQGQPPRASGSPGGGAVGKPASQQHNMDFILDIPLEITVELGRTTLMINDLLKLGQGSVVELSKIAGENLEVLANQRLIARGEVVVVNEKYGIRLTEIISPMERIERLR
jgi:flagellar motor switch protein FliN/FliY